MKTGLYMPRQFPFTGGIFSDEAAISLFIAISMV